MAELITPPGTTPRKELAARQDLFALAGILLLAGAINSYGLWLWPLTEAEAATLAFARQSLGVLWGEEARVETNPPLFYTMQHVWLGFFGTSEPVLRSLSAFLGTLTVLPVYGIGRVLAGRRAGLLAALLFATAPFFVTYAQSARAYTLLALAATTAILGLTYLLAEPQRALRPIGASLRAGTNIPAGDARRSDLAWLAYALGTTVTLYAHNTGALLPLVANLVVLPWWLVRARGDVGFVRNWLLANLLPLVLWLWWLLIMIGQVMDPASAVSWIPSIGLQDMLKSARTILGQGYATPLIPLLGPLPHAAIPLAMLLGLWWMRRHLSVAAPVIAFLIITPALIALVSLVVPIWLTRILIWPAALAFVVAAVGLAAIRSPLVRSLAAVGLLALQGVNLLGYYNAQANNRVHYEAWDVLAAEVAQRAEPQDAILFLRPGYRIAAYEYYDQRPELPRFGLDYIGFPKLAIHLAPLIAPSELRGVLDRYGTVWAIGKTCPEKVRVCDPALDAGLELVEVWHSYLLVLYRLEAPVDPLPPGKQSPAEHFLNEPSDPS